MKYVGEAYPKGVHSVYCVRGKDVEETGSDFELVVVISAARHSPQNFCWRSIWNVEFKDDLQIVGVRGRIQVRAHYFEEGNVQLDAKHECKDSTIFQSADDSAISLTKIIRHHETEYLAALQASYLNLPYSTFKVWRFLITFSDVLGLWPFMLDEFVQAFHDYDPSLLGEIHVALLRSIIKDIEDVARTPSSTGLGVNQNTAANPGGGHPQIVEGISFVLWRMLGALIYTASSAT